MPSIVSEIVEVYVFKPGDAGPRFLQLKRAPASYLGETWHPVAGRIEPGETAVQAALREMHEETGLTPVRFWQLEAVNTFYVARSDQIMLCPGFAAEVPRSAEARLSAEHVDARWLEWPEIRDHTLWPGQRAALDELREEIIDGRPSAPFLRLTMPAHRDH